MARCPVNLKVYKSTFKVSSGFTFLSCSFAGFDISEAVFFDLELFSHIVNLIKEVVSWVGFLVVEC